MPAAPGAGARCYGDKNGCRSDQFCLAPCAPGSMWVAGGCPPCSELIAGCDLCERCILTRNSALNKMVRRACWALSLLGAEPAAC